MADRKAQLLAAFDEAEENDEEVVTGEESGESDEDASKDDAGGSSDNDESVLESKDSDNKGSASESGAGSDDKETDERPVPKGAAKSKAGSDSDKSVGGGRTSKVLPKGDASKGAKDDAAKKAEQDELDAAKAAEEAERAPKSWKPGVREKWAKLPSDVKDEVLKRETEITQFMGRHGNAIQHKQQFDEVIQPFLPFIAAQQSTPMKAVQNLMTTAARLVTGSPQGKAQVICEIMEGYGIDVKTLDEVLSARLNGRMPAGGGNPQQYGNQPPAWAQPLFKFMNDANSSRASREQQTQDAAAKELAEFEKKPFFSDLREDIAMLMTRAAQRGEAMTLEQAYTKARKMNSEVDAILTQREKAANKNKNSGESNIDKSRKAASSIRGAPGGAQSGAKTNGAQGGAPLTRRQQLEAAIDAARED